MTVFSDPVADLPRPLLRASGYIDRCLKLDLGNEKLAQKETEGESKSAFGSTTATRICLTPLELRGVGEEWNWDGLGSQAFAALLRRL
jgi:hypothetical protein